MDNYAVMKSEAIKADAANKERDDERRLQGNPVGKGRPFVPTPSTSATSQVAGPVLHMPPEGTHQPQLPSKVQGHGASDAG